MLTWLDESITTLCVLLGTLAVILVIVWWQTRKRVLAIAAAVPVALIALLFLVAYFVETDSERIEKSVHQMVAGLKAQDLDRIFAQISERFKYAMNDRATFRQKVGDTMRRQHVVDAKVWDFKLLAHSPEKGTARMQFSVKPEGSLVGEAYYICRADFVLEPDGQWRLVGFQIFNPYVDDRLIIPGYD